MLLKLPTEVILEISRHVDFKNKLNLMTTCRRLNDLISNATLYEYLDTGEYLLDTDKIIEQFKNKKINGSQVKSLHTKVQDLSGGTILQLPNIFPNLTSVSNIYFAEMEMLQHYSYRGKSERDGIEYNKDKYMTPYESSTKQIIEDRECNWINSIQKYRDQDDFYVIGSMLQRYTFPNLVELDMSGHLAVENHREKYPNATCLVPYLKNMPALRKLVLRCWTLSVKLLDDIHAICPLIQSLELAMIEIDNDTLPQPIVPANNVLKLKLYDTIAFDKEHLYLEYVLQKYPNIQYLYLDTKLVDLYTRKMSSTFPFRLLEEDESTKGKREAEEEARGLASLEIRARFISRLPKTIKILVWDLHAEDCIKYISEFGVNIVTLDLARYYTPKDILPTSNIKTLRTFSFSWDYCGGSKLEGALWPTVTKLTFKCIEDCVYIEWFLSLFPSLEYLDITSEEGIKLGKFKHLAEKKYPNLRTINIHESRVDRNFYAFIKQAAPNLRVFNVNTYLDYDSVKIGYHIDLTGLHLKRFSLQVYNRGERDKGFLAKVAMQGACKTFIFLVPSGSILVSPEEEVYRKMLIAGEFSIECYNIDDLTIHSKPIKRFGDTLLCG